MAQGRDIKVNQIDSKDMAVKYKEMFHTQVDLFLKHILSLKDAVLMKSVALAIESSVNKVVSGHYVHEIELNEKLIVVISNFQRSLVEKYADSPVRKELLEFANTLNKKLMELRSEINLNSFNVKEGQYYDSRAMRNKVAALCVEQTNEIISEYKDDPVMVSLIVSMRKVEADQSLSQRYALNNPMMNCIYAAAKNNTNPALARVISAVQDKIFATLETVDRELFTVKATSPAAAESLPKPR